MKRTFYFPHDYNARQDPKLQDLLMTHGVAGIGVYWCIVEMLYEQGGELPLSAIRQIAFSLHVKTAFVKSVISDFNLFYINKEILSSYSVKTRISSQIAISEKNRANANKRWRRQQSDNQSDTPQIDEDNNVCDRITTAMPIASSEDAVASKIDAIKRNKINNISTTSTYKGNGSDFLEDVRKLQTEQIWLESVAIRNRLSVDEVKQRFPDFVNEWIANGAKPHRDIADIKSHFSNWLRIELAAEKKQNDEKYKPTDRAAERQARADELRQRVFEKISRGK